MGEEWGSLKDNKREKIEKRKKRKEKKKEIFFFFSLATTTTTTKYASISRNFSGAVAASVGSVQF